MLPEKKTRTISPTPKLSKGLKEARYDFPRAQVKTLTLASDPFFIAQTISLSPYATKI